MTNGTVVARFVAEDGSTPLSGYVDFALSAPVLLDNAGAKTIVPQHVRATLDATGSISIALQANTDLGVMPQDTQWVASPVLSRAGSPVVVPEIPFTLDPGETVDLTVAAPIIEAAPARTYLSAADVAALRADAADALSAAAEALFSASASDASADLAQAAADLAAAARDAAIAARDSATASAGAASTSAGAAASSEAAADADRIAAQTARTEAEAARDLSLAGQFAGSFIAAGTNLDTITTPGVYFQSTVSEVTLANGYPTVGTNGRGVLRVFRWASAAGNLLQIYTTIGAPTVPRTTYSRRLASGVWSPWTAQPAQRIDPLPGQPGVGIYTWDDVNSTERRLMPGAIDLGVVDLDLVTAAGFYSQPASASATLARNYPLSGGIWTLLVEYVSTDRVYQTAVPVDSTTSAGRVQYRRRGFFTGGAWTWSAWFATPRQRIDETAGRAIYTWDDLNNREQIVYGDTGWRRIDSELANGWLASQLLVRRVGQTIELIAQGLDSSAATAANLWPVPLGFRPAYGFPLFARPASSFDGPIYGSVGTGTSSSVGIITGRAFNNTSLQATWTTTDAWPTALPGNPVGSIPNL